MKLGCTKQSIIKRAIHYPKRGEKNLNTWFRESKKCFRKRFMILAMGSHITALNIRRVENNLKINSICYQNYTLFFNIQ